jgi:hypothetical protein
VKHVVATRHGIFPTFIRGQIGGEESQAVGRTGGGRNSCPHHRFLCEIAYGGAHQITAAQKLDDAPAGNETCSASNQHYLNALR